MGLPESDSNNTLQLNLNAWTNHCQLEEDRQGYIRVTLQVQTHTHTHVCTLCTCYVLTMTPHIYPKL